MFCTFWVIWLLYYLYVFTFRLEEENSTVEENDKLKISIEQLEKQVKEVSTIDLNKINFYAHSSKHKV